MNTYLIAAIFCAGLALFNLYCFFQQGSETLVNIFFEILPYLPRVSRVSLAGLTLTPGPMVEATTQERTY